MGESTLAVNAEGLDVLDPTHAAVLKKLVSARVAWQTAGELATAAGLDVAEAEEAAAELVGSGWLTPWDYDGRTQLVLTPLAMEFLNVTLGYDDESAGGDPRYFPRSGPRKAARSKLRRGDVSLDQLLEAHADDGPSDARDAGGNYGFGYREYRPGLDDRDRERLRRIPMTLAMAFDALPCPGRGHVLIGGWAWSAAEQRAAEKGLVTCSVCLGKPWPAPPEGENPPPRACCFCQRYSGDERLAYLVRKEKRAERYHKLPPRPRRRLKAG